MRKQPNRDTAIVAVHDDVEALRTIETALRRRFGADYEIVAETSPERALERCRKLRDSGVQMAILRSCRADTAAGCSVGMHPGHAQAGDAWR